MNKSHLNRWLFYLHLMLKMKSLITSFLIFFIFNSYAGILKGIVTAENGEPLSFANVFVKTTGTGTTTNAEGYYILELPGGEYEIIYKYLGYKTQTKTIIIDQEEHVLNINLEKESVWLNEVVVKPGVEDPAYQIIRNAIANKKPNSRETDEYECQVYIKGLQKLDKFPKRLLGIKINIDEYVDPKTGIIYLSESISNLKFKYPAKYNEDIISSKVSGNNKAFSFNRASDFNFSVYDNLIDLGISQRLFVSPISNNAFFYYKYRLEGVTEENNQVVYKIRLLPVRQHDPVFRGYIYVAEDRWRVQSIDIIVTKDAIIEFVDTLRIKQIIMPVAENIWMPVSLHLSFNFNVFGFEGNGYFTAVYQNYKLNNNFKNKTFKGEIITIKKESNKRDEEYWEKVRPVPLTLEEKLDYIRKDSIYLIKETDTYKDSIDAVNNEFSISKLLLLGLNISKRKNEMEYNVKPLIETSGYNTVQGWNAGLLVDAVKKLDDYKKLNVKPYINYGFSDKKLNLSAEGEYSYNRQKFASVGLKTGAVLTQYNSHEPVGIFANTISTLFYERNYLKLYDKKFIHIFYKSEIFNGLLTEINFEYASRSAVENSADYLVTDFKNRFYTTNLPDRFDDVFISDNTVELPFLNNNLFFSQIKLKFIPGAKYYSRPSGKYLLANNNPTFHFNIKKAIPVAEATTDYIFAEAGITQDINLKNAGSTTLYINAGKFLTKKNLIFPDWAHFNGNRLFLVDRETNQFRLLDYYSHSTTKPFLELHAEHQFAGYFFNKIPVIRKLKLTEVAGLHVLTLDKMKPHYEISLGIEKLGFRLEYSFVPEKGTKSGALRLMMPF